MSEITREEFTQTMDRVFKTVEDNHKEVHKAVGKIAVDMAIVKTKLEAIVIPEFPARPCQFFECHIEDHKQAEANKKDTVDSWKRPIIVGLVTLAIIFITQVLPVVIGQLLEIK